MLSVLETRERATIAVEAQRVLGSPEDNVFLARTIAPPVYVEQLEWEFATGAQALGLRAHFEGNAGAFAHTCVDGIVRQVEYDGPISITWARPNSYRMAARVREAIATD